MRQSVRARSHASSARPSSAAGSSYPSPISSADIHTIHMYPSHDPRRSSQAQPPLRISTGWVGHRRVRCKLPTASRHHELFHCIVDKFVPGAYTVWHQRGLFAAAAMSSHTYVPPDSNWSFVCLLSFLRVAYFPYCSISAPPGDCRWLSLVGNAAYACTKLSNNGKASASTNAVSRERLAPIDAAADAVTPAFLLATNCGVVHGVYDFSSLDSTWFFFCWRVESIGR